MSKENSQKNPDNLFVGLTVNFNEQSLSFNGRTVDFVPSRRNKESVLFSMTLRALQSIGEPLKDEELLPAVQYKANNDSLRMNISLVNKKLSELFTGHSHGISLLSERSFGYRPSVRPVGNISRKPNRRQISLDGNLIEFREADYSIFSTLHSNLGGICSAEDLGVHAGQKTRRVDVYVCRVKAELREHGINSLQIENVLKKGYKMQFYDENGNEVDSHPACILNPYENHEQQLKTVLAPQFIGSR